MKPEMLERPEVAFGVDAVRQAALLVRQVQAEMVTPALEKGNKSPVTVGDYSAQALLGRLLEQHFPDDRLVAEEESSLLRESPETLERVASFVSRVEPTANSEKVTEWIDRGTAEPGGRFWTLDPIDGTKGFLRGEQYAVCLALLIDGEVQFGAMACPNLEDSHRIAVGGSGSLLVACRGSGTWVTSLTDLGDYRRLQVSEQNDPTQARLVRSVEAGHTNIDQVGEIASVLGVAAQPVALDSQAKYAVLAAGGGELLFRLLSPSRPDYREYIWDQAAGSILVEEAGGKATDLDGKPLDFSQGRRLERNRGILASNGHLHPQALAAIREVGA